MDEQASAGLYRAASSLPFVARGLHFVRAVSGQPDHSVSSMRWRRRRRRRRSQTRPGGDSADPAIPVTLVPATVDANKEIYHIKSWPKDVGSVDLGHRVIDAIPILGHSKASIALYDRKTAIPFSGDTLYPGRLYTNSYPDFVASVTRLLIWPLEADQQVARQAVQGQ